MLALDYGLSRIFADLGTAALRVNPDSDHPMAMARRGEQDYAEKIFGRGTLPLDTEAKREVTTIIGRINEKMQSITQLFPDLLKEEFQSACTQLAGDMNRKSWIGPEGIHVREWIAPADVFITPCNILGFRSAEQALDRLCALATSLVSDNKPNIEQTQQALSAAIRLLEQSLSEKDPEVLITCRQIKAVISKFIDFMSSQDSLANADSLSNSTGSGGSCLANSADKRPPLNFDCVIV